MDSSLDKRRLCWFQFPKLTSDASDSDASIEVPSWVSDARKSMMEMHNRMMNMFMYKNDAEDIDVDDIFQQVFDMRNDMSEFIF